MLVLVDWPQEQQGVGTSKQEHSASGLRNQSGDQKVKHLCRWVFSKHLSHKQALISSSRNLHCQKYFWEREQYRHSAFSCPFSSLLCVFLRPKVILVWGRKRLLHSSCSRGEHWLLHPSCPGGEQRGKKKDFLHLLKPLISRSGERERNLFPSLLSSPQSCPQGCAGPGAYQPVQGHGVASSWSMEPCGGGGRGGEWLGGMSSWHMVAMAGPVWHYPWGTSRHRAQDGHPDSHPPPPRMALPLPIDQPKRGVDLGGESHLPIGSVGTIALLLPSPPRSDQLGNIQAVIFVSLSCREYLLG